MNVGIAMIKWQLPKKMWQSGIAKMLPNYSILFWTSAFSRKGVLWFDHCQYVSMSVGKRVFSKTTHRFFLKLLMKLGSLKGKKLAELDFGGGNLILGIMPKNTLKIGLFGFCKKIVHWSVDFLNLNHVP